MRSISVAGDTGMVLARTSPEKTALRKDDSRQGAADKRYQRRPQPGMHQRKVIYVHAVETEHDCGHRQNQRDDGQTFHGVVHAVVDDVAEGVHGFIQQFRADLAHFNRLPKLDAHIVKQIFVFIEPIFANVPSMARSEIEK